MAVRIRLARRDDAGEIAAIYRPFVESTIISFEVSGIHPHDLATILDREGVAVRGGHHCAQPLMQRFDVTGTARASFALYNSEGEIDALVDAVTQARRVFGNG